MKNFLKALVFVSVAVPAFAVEPAPQPAIEQDKYDLKCTDGQVCLEQSMKNPKHSFHTDPGSVVRVEVNAKNGASLSLVSGGNTMSASYLAVGNSQPEKQNVELESTIDKSGDFTLEVTIAKISVNGKPQNADGGSYTLKITKVGAAKAKEIPGESI